MKLAIHLVNIRNEFNRLHTWLIDFYIRSRFHRALYINQRLSDILSFFDNSSRRGFVKNEAFHEKFCELIALLYTLSPCKECPKVPSHERVTRKVEELLIQVDTLEPSKFVDSLFKGHMTDYTRALMNILYNRIKHNDRKNAAMMTLFIMGCGINHVSVDKIDDDIFKVLKQDHRGDVVWYIWKLLYHLCKSKMKTCNSGECERWNYCFNLVKHGCSLSEAFYVKTSRDARAILLVRVMSIVLSSKLDISISNDMVDYIHTSAKTLHKEYFTKQFPKKKHITQYSLVKKPFKKKEIDNDALDEEDNVNGFQHVYKNKSKSLDYLKVFTYMGDVMTVNTEAEF